MLSESYYIYMDLWTKADQLTHAGKGETYEADKIRDSMDMPWRGMTKVERKSLDSNPIFHGMAYSCRELLQSVPKCSGAWTLASSAGGNAVLDGKCEKPALWSSDGGRWKFCDDHYTRHRLQHPTLLLKQFEWAQSLREIVICVKAFEDELSAQAVVES